MDCGAYGRAIGPYKVFQKIHDLNPMLDIKAAGQSINNNIDASCAKARAMSVLRP